MFFFDSSQFGISGAAVARVWADKVSEWVTLGDDDGGAATEMRRFWMFALDPFPRVFGGISPLAGLLQAACVLVLLRGVEMGKRVTTVMTAIKVIFFGGWIGEWSILADVLYVADVGVISASRWMTMTTRVGRIA